MSIKEHPPQQHVPVLLTEVVRQLDPQTDETYLDLTAGYGGHASVILDRTGNFSGAYLVDRDEYAITHLSHLSEKGASVLRNDFVSAAKLLITEGKQFDIILVDLGVSSPQLDMGARGFSFTHDGPLDMRMDNRQALTASAVVNEWSKSELQRVICDYGEESYTQAGIIAEAIIRDRPLRTTAELAATVKSVHRGRKAKIHPATRTFQAIRIAVNDELRQVSDLLPLIPQLLNHGGRVAIISFHSLEDRLVKQYFKSQVKAGYEAELAEKTKKPIDGATYDVHNPRSRSAKLRVAVKP
jgi:16S rRNA (cytosine1402-N4)-methyltransferase